jgi:hypothetical protein
MTQIDIIRQMLVGDREPDEIINDTVNGEQVPYLRRWFVKKDEDGGRVYLHNFMRSDFERATHDHPWDSTSILLWGEYKEHLADGTVAYRKSGDIVTRKAEDSHRIELIYAQPTWSLFITGPKVREWGFNCESGWVHHSQFNIATCG